MLMHSDKCEHPTPSQHNQARSSTRNTCSRSCSPVRNLSGQPPHRAPSPSHKCSRQEPKHSTHKKPPFQNSAASPGLHACAVCLSCFAHNIHKCKANSCGTGRLPHPVKGMVKDTSSTPKDYSCVMTGNAPMDAPAPARTISTNVLAVAPWIMELRSALEARKHNALTPYNTTTWSHFLNKSGLICIYPHIPQSLQFGFKGSIPPITYTYTPPNSSSIVEHASAFSTILS